MTKQLIGIVLGLGLISMGSYAAAILLVDQLTNWPLMLTLLAVFTGLGELRSTHAEQAELVSWYWHFVDAVWIVVLTVVYIIGR